MRKNWNSLSAKRQGVAQFPGATGKAAAVLPAGRTMTPKKPNSALRKIGPRPPHQPDGSDGLHPGDRPTNLQEHSVVLVRGRSREGPAVRQVPHHPWHRSTPAGVKDRKQGRSKYGAKAFSRRARSNRCPVDNTIARKTKYRAPRPTRLSSRFATQADDRRQATPVGAASWREALARAEAQARRPGVEVLESAMRNATPIIEVKPRPRRRRHI